MGYYYKRITNRLSIKYELYDRYIWKIVEDYCPNTFISLTYNKKFELRYARKILIHRLLNEKKIFKALPLSDKYKPDKQMLLEIKPTDTMFGIPFDELFITYNNFIERINEELYTDKFNNGINPITNRPMEICYYNNKLVLKHKG